MSNCDFLSQIIDRYKAAMFTVQRRLPALLRGEMPEDLTFDQFCMLQYISVREQCTSSELAEAFCVGKSSITAIISRLVDKSLIRRVPDDRDRRVTHLRLTESGKKVAEELDGRVAKVLSVYVNAFEEKEALQFIETYEKLARVLMQDGLKQADGEGVREQ